MKFAAALFICLSVLQFASAQLTATTQKTFDDRFQFLVDRGGYPSIVVGIIRGDNLVFSRAYGVTDLATKKPARVNTLYKVGSVGKVFTASLLMMMRDEGRLKLDDSVEESLPPGVNLQHDPRGAPWMTFRHLATHSSGLPEWPAADPRVYDPNPGLTEAERFAAFTEDPLEFPIGARFRYSGDGYSLLGIVLERIGGDTYENLLRRELFQPLGMQDTVITVSDQQRSRIPHQYAWDGTEVNQDPANPGDRWEFATSAHFSTVPDIAKFVSLQLKAGMEGISPLSGGTLWEMQTPQQLQNNWSDAVGIGWWIEPNSELGNIVWHKGGSRGFGSYVAFSRTYQVGVVLFTNRNRSLEQVGRWLVIKAALDLGQPRATLREEADRYFKWRDWANAAIGYRFLLDKEPKDAELWYKYGSTLQRIHQCDKAISAFRRAGQFTADRDKASEISYSIARCDLELGRKNEALAHLTKAVAMGFKDEDGELATDGLFEPLWNDPRFVQLLRKLH